MNDNRQKRLSEALRANLKRRKQQARGRADKAGQDDPAQQVLKPADGDDTGAPVAKGDKRA